MVTKTFITTLISLGILVFVRILVTVSAYSIWGGNGISFHACHCMLISEVKARSLQQINPSLISILKDFRNATLASFISIIQEDGNI